MGGVTGRLYGLTRPAATGATVAGATAAGATAAGATAAEANAGGSAFAGRAGAAFARARPARQPRLAAIPIALDLVAACLAGGCTLPEALTAVADAVGGPAGEVLGAAARLHALGEAPEVVWAVPACDPAWAPVARAVVRAHHSGAPLADVLAHAAVEQRRAVRAHAQVATAQAAVHAVLPLGLCFLPAFILLGVLPVIAGFARALWS